LGGSIFSYYSKLTEPLPSATINDDDVVGPLSNNLKIVHYEPPSIEPSRVLNFNRSETLNRDMVVFVQGDLYITSNVRIQEGRIAAFVVSGDIYINQNVENIEGIFVTDKRIHTYCTAPRSCTRQTGIGPTLNLSGMFYALEGFSLGRRGDPLGNNPRPGEQFTMRPDLLLRSSQLLGVRSANFFEVDK
jgi:hypothetical protein